MATHNNPRTTISTGQGSPSKLPELLSVSYPFVQQECCQLYPAVILLNPMLIFCLQLDTIFPTNSGLEQKLKGLSGAYRKFKLELSQVLDAAYSLTGKYTTQNELLALSSGVVDYEDVWCIDHRGLMTLAVTKETYQQLGLVGKKRSKKSEERFVIQLDLSDRTSHMFTRAKESFQLWDERRKSQGLGPWEVLLGGSIKFSQSEAAIEMPPLFSSLHDIRIPQIDLSAPNTSYNITEKEEHMEDWQERMADLFEWIGMACLHSERIKVNDRVNPYVALYEVPTPSTTDSLSHIRWRGFLTPAFVQLILKTLFDSCASPSPDSRLDLEFIAVTSNTFLGAPLSHISPKAFAEGAKTETKLNMSPRDVRCWSLLGKPSEGTEMVWALANVESQK